MKSWYFPLVRVEQADNNGCAIAATAIVCGVTYERARATFFPRTKAFKDDKSLHMAGPRIQGAVRRLGFSTVLSPRSFIDARVPAILVFDWEPGAEWTSRHSVVWDPFEARIIDPGSDWERHQPRSFYFNLWKKSGYAAMLVTGRR